MITAHVYPFDTVKEGPLDKAHDIQRVREPERHNGPIDENWIETYTGKKFHFLDPRPDDVDIEDIAHALSNNCRFTGHCRNFYSVAEHSVYVSMLVRPSLRLAGILHDASEAYIADISSPVKPYLGNYKEIETVIMKAIATRFELEYPFHADIKQADNNQLLTEAKTLIRSKGATWGNGWNRLYSGEGIAPVCMPPLEAKRFFLKYFRELMQ